MSKRTFRLLKESPELKKGAIMIDKCDDGDQGFKNLNNDNLKYYDEEAGNYVTYSMDTILKQPEWFEEVKIKYVPVKRRDRLANK